SQEYAPGGTTTETSSMLLINAGSVPTVAPEEIETFSDANAVGSTKVLPA
ncbi:unnamed protein product, partial [marine sediment metagenome]